MVRKIQDFSIQFIPELRLPFVDAIYERRPRMPEADTKNGFELAFSDVSSPPKIHVPFLLCVLW